MVVLTDVPDGALLPAKEFWPDLAEAITEILDPDSAEMQVVREEFDDLQPGLVRDWTALGDAIAAEHGVELRFDSVCGSFNRLLDAFLGASHYSDLQPHPISFRLAQHWGYAMQYEKLQVFCDKVLKRGDT